MKTLSIQLLAVPMMILTCCLTAQTTLGPLTFFPTNLGGTMQGQVQISEIVVTADDIIAAFGPGGECVGASQISIYNGVAYINFVIYGDDGGGHGMNAGEDFTLKIRDSSNHVTFTYSHALSGWQNSNFAPMPGFNNPNVIYNFNSKYFTVSPSVRNVDSQQGTTTFTVNSNTVWTVSENELWFEVIPLNGSNNGTLSVIYEINYGAIRSGNITVSASGLPDVTVIIEQEPASVQMITIPEGWSGISSYINPFHDNLEFIFNPVINEMIILQNESGIYWPEENINTLGSWNHLTGYQIKVTDDVELTISGSLGSNNTLQLNNGWNLIPVLSQCAVNVSELFESNDLIIIKEAAGSKLFWPEMGINSIGELQPGKAYLVKMNSPGNITFHDCD